MFMAVAERERQHADLVYERQKRSVLESDAQYALLLKSHFYAALGILPGSPEYERKLSYEPWVERARFERDKEVLPELFKEATFVQLAAVLKERYNSEKNKFRYNIKDGKLYSEFLATEPFDNILLRGLEYRRKEGSLELTREEKEVEGFFDVIQGVFGNLDTPVGTKMVLFSPPGLLKDSQYKKRLVDIFELKQDENGQRFVEPTRFTSGLNYDGYKKTALKLDPHYFDEYKASDMPLDAWFLAHPIVIGNSSFGSPEEIYDRFIEKDYTAMKEEEFKKVLISCMPAIQYYISELTKDVVDWRELATSFNAILNIGDKTIEGMERRKHLEDLENVNTKANLVYSRKEMLFWGQKETRTVAGGCPGVSSGFKIGYGFQDASEALSNSVGKFGLETEGVMSCVTCPFCQETVDAILTEDKIICPKCNKSANRK